MLQVTDFIKKTRDDRRAHLRLQEPCCTRGGNSTNHKGVLAEYLQTSIPNVNDKILLCHACNNGACSNPRHLYWGTYRENTVLDNPNFKTRWQRSVEKYGYEEACRMNARGNKKNGGSANKGKPKSEEHKLKIAAAIKEKHRKKKSDSASMVE